MSKSKGITNHPATEPSPVDQNTITQANRNALIITGVTALLMIICLFVRDNAVLLAMVFACLPLSIGWIWRYRKAISLFKKYTNREASRLTVGEWLTSLAIPMFVGVFFMTVNKDVDAGDWGQVLRIAIIVTIPLALFMTIGVFPALGAGSIVWCAMTGFLFLTASYHLVLAENRLLDKSEATIYESQIIDKWISGGKNRHYRLEVNPWKGQGEAVKLDVSTSIYDAASVHGKIRMYAYKGAFNIPWYRIALP